MCGAAVQQIPFASSAGSRGATLSLISPGACSFSAELVWGVIVGDFGKNQELFIRLYTFGKSPKPSKLGAGMSRQLRKVEIGLLGVFRDVPYSRNEWYEKSEDRRSDVLLSLVAKVAQKKQKTTRSIQKFLI